MKQIWNASKIIIDRKSKFQARNVLLNNKNDIGEILTQFLAQHKSASRASHPHIIGWRCENDQGFKDYGEKGGGSRILDVLVKHDLVNILVIVTRWYGGSPIGSSRFKHITYATLDSLRISNKI